MLQLILLGVLASAFFSSTFILNELMATQATEVVFALIGGMLLLSTPLPSVLSWVGIVLVTVGIVLFTRIQK